MRYLTYSVSALAMCFFLAGVRAEDKKEDKEAAKQNATTKAALDVGAAFRIAGIGRETKSPEALIAGAKVIGTTSFGKVEDLKDKKTEVEKAEKFVPGAEAESLLAEAGKLAGEKNEAIAGLIKAARTYIRENDPAKRGAVGGPQTRRGTVSSGDRQDTIAIRFKGGESAFVLVNNTSNRGDIDLVVENDNGQVVARDRRADDDASCSFFVPKTGTYYIKIKKFGNRGGALRYSMTTN